MPARMATLLVLCALAAALVAGCGGSDSEPEAGASGASGATGVAGAIPEGAVPEDGPPDPDLTVQQVSEAMPLPPAVTDDEKLKKTIDVLIAAPHKFFSETSDRSNIEYHMPDEFIAYDGASGDKGPECLGTRAGIENAMYCRDPRDKGSHGMVAWDETGLIEPLYEDLGDGSTAFILGHEFAHLFQDRFGTITKFRFTIEKELQADCLTGAYLGAYRDRAGINYSRKDMQSIVNGINVVGDAPGTPWQNIHAHGSASLRREAFFLGFEKGINRCLIELRPGFTVR